MALHASCRLANLVLPPPGLRFKHSGMPFIQMENISHFLRACEAPPLNMPAHDRFLTVDLFESKDPAQVLQCLSAFSRVAHAVAPAKFPTTIGPSTKRAGAMSPASTGTAPRTPTFTPRGYSATPSSAFPSARPLSPALTGDSNASSRAASAGLKSTTGTVSSWTKKSDQGTTSPAWNIHQYGYMGGASQGNQGVAFGARRQITTAGPHVPSLAEKERKRKEKEADDERVRVETEESERTRRAQLDVEEERERLSEERKWEEETRRQRDEERRRIEEQKRQWEEQERKWQAEEDTRLKEEALASKRNQAANDARLKGQFLSQYQTEQASMAPPRSPKESQDTPERRRVKELERQLDEARERERQYQREREERSRQDIAPSHAAEHDTAPDAVPRPSSPKDSEASWAPDEREYLQRQWQGHQPSKPSLSSTRPLPTPGASKSGPRPLPEPSTPVYQAYRIPQQASPTSPGVDSGRPLPTPETHMSPPALPNRTDRFLASNPAPEVANPISHQPAEMGFSSTFEEQSDRDRRMASQQKTKAGGWASKSLLEREMERERERQREWEANQQATSTVARDTNEGSGEGQSWDVNQYGYTGGDGQNRGSGTGSGIAFGGRRQIIGPRPLP